MAKTKIHKLKKLFKIKINNQYNKLNVILPIGTLKAYKSLLMINQKKIKVIMTYKNIIYNTNKPKFNTNNNNILKLHQVNK